MPKSAFHRFQALGAHLLKGYHDLRLVLCTDAPNAAGDGQFGSLTGTLAEIYPLEATVKRSGASGQLAVKPLVVNADKEPIGPFRYGVLVKTSGECVGFVDCGEPITLDKFESYRFAFPGVVLSVNV